MTVLAYKRLPLTRVILSGKNAGKTVRTNAYRKVMIYIGKAINRGGTVDMETWTEYQSAKFGYGDTQQQTYANITINYEGRLHGRK